MMSNRNTSMADGVVGGLKDLETNITPWTERQQHHSSKDYKKSGNSGNPILLFFTRIRSYLPTSIQLLVQRILVLRKLHPAILTITTIVTLVILFVSIVVIRQQMDLQKTAASSLPPPRIALKSIMSNIATTVTNLSTKTSSSSSSSSSSIPSNWPKVSYFEELPSVDDPLWPPLPESSTPSTTTTTIATTTTTTTNTLTPTSIPTISTCVPGLAQDIYKEKQIENFFESNIRQVVPAQELIFLLSDVNAVIPKVQQSTRTRQHTHNDSSNIPTTTSGKEWCEEVYSVLNNYHANFILVCLGERITAGRARNVLARVASSDILAYIDTDDQEEPQRNQVIRDVFYCHGHDLKLLLHSNYGTGHGLYGKIRYHPYDALSSTSKNLPITDVVPTNRNQCPDEQEGVEVIRGLELRDMLDQTQDVMKFGIRTVAGMRPGHLVVRREVTRYVRSSSIYKGQDTLWARDIIYMYGRRDTSAMFLNRPLTTYFQSSHSFNVNIDQKKKKKMG